MDKDEYDKVEGPALEQLQQLGWQYIHGSKLSPESSDERGYYRDVILTSFPRSRVGMPTQPNPGHAQQRTRMPDCRASQSQVAVCVPTRSMRIMRPKQLATQER